MLRHILILVFALHCTAGVPLAQPKEDAKAEEMNSLFEDDISKRSKEVIKFGNQQNKGKNAQAGMIDSDLVPQDSNGSDDDDDKNGHDEGHKDDRSDDHKLNDDQSQSDESEGHYEPINHGIIPVQGIEYSPRPYKEDVEDILPELIDAYKAEEDWGNYKKSPYDYYRDLVFRRKRSMDRRHAMKKRNYVAPREHLIKRRSEKRSRYRRDLNLDEEELMQLINMLKEERSPYERKRKQYYAPDSDEDDDNDDNREGFNAEELNRMFNGDSRQELYNPYYYSTEDNDMPPPNSNTYRFLNDKDDDSDEDDDDDDWRQMSPARPIDLRRRSEFFYPPTDYRYMMIPGQKRRLPMHEEESEGLWGSFDDKRAVKKKKRNYYFGEGKDEDDEDDDDDDDDESGEEKLRQILELASYMNSHNRDYRSFR